jgi:hypothetical protein
MINIAKKFNYEYQFVNSKPSLKDVNKRFNGNKIMVVLHVVYKIFFVLRFTGHKSIDSWLEALIFEDMSRRK